MSCKTRRRVRLRCGEERFSKPPLMVKQTADRAVQSRSRTPQRPAACSVDNDQETYGFSTKVLIHGWQKRRMKAATYYYGRKYRDCTRCVDMKSSDWSPDMIIRRREHPAAIFQAPLPPNLEKTRCVYAVQLKSWYDEQYNDWAKRYLREQLYNVDGIDRAAEYMYRNLPQLTTPRKKISPTKVTDDKEYLITQCMPQNYGLLEKKQAQWRKDIDILLGRRVPDTTHHDEFPSAYRTAVRQPPSPPPAACLRPRRRYSMSEKTLPCGEIELCIHCEDPPTVTEEHEVSAPCTDRLLAV